MKNFFIVLILLISICFSSTQIVFANNDISSIEYIKLQGENKKLEEEISYLKSQINSYEKRVSILEKDQKSNKEMFDIFTEYIKDLLLILGLAVTILIVMVEIYTKNVILNKVNEYIQHHLSDDKLTKIIKPQVDTLINESENEIKSFKKSYEIEFSQLLRMIKRGTDR